MKGMNLALVVLVIALVVVVIGVVVVPGDNVFLQPTDPETATSRVSIDKVVQITRSSQLAVIDFGNVDPPVTDRAALGNTQGAGGATVYSVSRGAQSTVPVEICIKADGALTETLVGTANIPLAGETYAFGATNQPTGPTGSTSLTTTNFLASATLTGTQSVYYRFWLDVSNAGQASGTYENTVTFTGQEAGGPAC